MTTSNQDPPTTGRLANARAALRLEMSDPTAPGALDGAWWPQSRDPTVELADLIDHFPRVHGEVHRVVISRPDWDTTPHRVRAARGPVKVGSYPHDDTHQVWLSMSTSELLRLSVRAPEHAATPATPRGPVDPGATATADESDLGAEEHWTDDGGSWWAPHRVPPSHRT